MTPPMAVFLLLTLRISLVTFLLLRSCLQDLIRIVFMDLLLVDAVIWYDKPTSSKLVFSREVVCATVCCCVTPKDLELF